MTEPIGANESDSGESGRFPWGGRVGRALGQVLDHLPVRVQLVGSMAALLAVVSLLVLIFFARSTDGLARRWLELRARGIATLLAHSMAPSLVSDEAERAEEQLRGLRSTKATYAVLWREDGSPFAFWNEALVPGAKVGPNAIAASHYKGKGELQVFEDGGLLQVIAPVRSGGEVKGMLAVGFSLSELNAERQANLLLAGGVSAGVFVLGLLVSILIGSLLGRPVRRLTEVAAQIARVDLSAAEAALGGTGEVRRLASLATDASKNEILQLTSAFARMLVALRETYLTLHESASRLTVSIDDLTASADAQSEVAARQAAALREAQMNAGEFKESSEEAARQADTLLRVADRASEVSRSGEQSIEQSLGGMAQIRERVEEIARKIAEQSASTLQVVGITETVRDLASQSHLLALNAAIEAARVGEFGTGFAVVAQEMRGLADRSIERTRQVETLLNQVTRATRGTLSITDEGVRRIQAGLADVRVSGEKLRALSLMVSDNSVAARQIAAAVNQQMRSVAQLFVAMTELGAMMDDTMRCLDSTNTAVGVVRDVSARVQALAERYRI